MLNLSDLRRQLLGIAPHHDPPDHYRRLGLARLELNQDVIDHAAERQLDHLQRNRAAVPAAEFERLQLEIEQARDCLIDHRAHLLYAGELQGYQSDSDDLDLQAAWRTFSEEFDDSWQSAQSSRPDPQHLWLGIPRHQRPASNERLLGLDDAERDADVIRSVAERQIGFVRKFASGDHAEQANLLLGQISRARSTLLRSAVATGSTRDSSPPSSESPETPPGVDAVFPATDFPTTDFPDVGDDLFDDLIPQSQALVPPAIEDLSTPPVFAGAGTAPMTTSSQGSKPNRLRSMNLVGGGVAALLFLGILGWLAFGGTSADPIATNPENANRNDQASRPTTNRRSVQQGRPGQPSGRNGNPGNGSSAQATNASLRQFLVRGRTVPPEQLDPEEIDRFAELATTASERMAIESIRRRYSAWRSHREKIDEARLMGSLIAAENSLNLIKGRRDRGASDGQDLEKIRDVLADLDGMLEAFPYHSDTLASRHATTVDAAEGLNNELKALLGSNVAPATSGSENPFIVDPNSTSNAPNGNAGAMSSDSAEPAAESGESRIPDLARDEPAGPESRKWTTTEGLTFDAFVDSIEDERVVFRRVSDDRKASMEVDQLLESDQLILRGMSFDQKDTTQYESAVQLVSTLASDPESAIDLLKDGHLKFVNSPYSGLWSAVCLSEGRNRPEEATRMLLQVIRRIEEQRKCFDDQRHAMTLAAACNNLGVCKVRVGELDAAATQFSKAMEATPVPLLAAAQNARRLLTQTPSERPLKAASRIKLERALARVNIGSMNLPNHWVYSLDADVPRQSLHGQQGFRFVRDALPIEPVIENHWCLRCGGSGKTPCDYGNCVRGVVVVKQRVQVAVNLTGEPIYGDKNFKQTCPHCRGAGGFDCRDCEEGRIP